MVNTHPGSKSLQCLSWSKPLMRKGKHLYRQWVLLRCLSRSELLTWQKKWINIYPGSESFFSVWADQNHWQEWMNSHLVCEFLSRFWTKQNLWHEWMNTHLASESLTKIWADQNHWQEWVNTYPGSEYVSNVWADQNHWHEWVNTHPDSEYLSSVKQFRTTDENGWTPIQLVSLSLRLSRSELLTRMVNTYSGSELLSRVWTGQDHLQERVNTHPVCESLFKVWEDQNHWLEWMNTIQKVTPSSVL